MKIEFINVNKNYGLINALTDISFVVNQGEFVLITGPSGTGKTSLLKLLLHQIKPSSGQILIDDVDISTLPKKQIDQLRVKIGVIFQDFQLITDKTVEENIALNLDIAAYPENKIPARIDEVLSQVNLKNRRHSFPGQLSGGELQRVALARALSNQPDLILADEPTGNLDIENSWLLLKLLKDINSNFGTTIIMTTHNQDIINSLDYPKILLRDGKIENINNEKIIKVKRSKKI